MPAGPPTKRAAAHEPSIAAPWAKTRLSWKNHLGGEVLVYPEPAERDVQVKSSQGKPAAVKIAAASLLESASQEFQACLFPKPATKSKTGMRTKRR